MNKSIACAFPETLPDERLLFPLVQVFGQVVYMQAIENEPPDKGTSSLFVERCRQEGRLRELTPAPLGDQRERFLALVQDMRRRGSDYTSQLSMLTLAGLSRREQKESKQSILADLLKMTDIKEQEAQELLLWQSRLVLKLGEFFDAQQTTLNQALGNIASRQDALLAELREEEDDLFAVATSQGEANQESDGMLDHRLKAWSRLCLHDASQPQGILVTGRPSAMDRLQEVYEKNHRRNAVLWASLELPAFAASGEETAANEPLIEQCPQLIAALEAMSLASGATLPEEEIKRLLAEGATQWAQGLDARASVRRGQCRVLEFYRFPKISVRQLLQEGFAGGDPASHADLSAPSSGCVVGLLRGK
jgi:hypothetical protein